MALSVQQQGPQHARCPGPTVQDHLAADTRPVPPLLLHESSVELGSEELDTSCYFDPDVHALEVERIWRRTWQLACREEDIPNVGDHVVYEVADDSLIVMRSAPGEVRAFFNACLHRGLTLREEGGTVGELRCPFHGFCWNLDGSLKDIPGAWDFPHVDQASFGLPEAKVGTWGGWVFLNMDPDAVPLEEFLGDIRDHMDFSWPWADRAKVVHVVKPVRCNWKIGVQAFLESWHAYITHPQGAAWVADACAQYDVYPGQPHFSRMLTLTGVPSPHVGEVDDQTIAEEMHEAYDIFPDEQIVVPEGQTARHVLAEYVRRALAGSTGADFSRASDTEVLDAHMYWIFPNLLPWAGIGSSIMVRVRPYGADPEMSLMDLMLLAPVPHDGPRPPAAPVQRLDADQRWTDVPAIGDLALAMDQDEARMVGVQRGMRTLRRGLTLGAYQESRIRHFRQTIDEYLKA